MIDSDAVDLFGRLGTFTSATSVSFSAIPSDAEWEAALGHQGVIRIGPCDAAQKVRNMLAALE